MQARQGKNKPGADIGYILSVLARGMVITMLAEILHGASAALQATCGS
jgi:hypothetical protein